MASGSAPSPTTTAAAQLPPAPQIPGRCDDFISAESVTALGGTYTVAAVDLGVPAAVAAEQQQAGQLRCSWSYAAPAGHQRNLDVLIRRHAEALIATWNGGGIQLPGGSPIQTGADESSMTCSEYGGVQTCQAALRVGDFVITSHVDRDGSLGSLDQAHSAYVNALAGLVQRLKTQPVPALWSRPAGAWSNPFDCLSIGEKGKLAAAVGWSSAVPGDSQDISLGGGTECLWSPPAGERVSMPEMVIADLVPGGGWYWSTFAARSGVRFFSAAGADHAGVLCADGVAGSCQVTAQVGSNIVSVTQSSDFAAGSGPELSAALVSAMKSVLSGLSG